MEMKAKTVSLWVKIFAVVFIVVFSVLKWAGIFTDCEIKDICFVGGVIACIFGDVSINTALDKFKKGNENE